MNGLKCFAFSVVAAICMMAGASQAKAQVSINIGVEPSCPYGYYDYAPYNCAPSGYYGPEWFHGRTFIGSGPWFHGSSNFHGKVNNRYDQQHGYKGAVPNRGDRAEASNSSRNSSFKGNEVRNEHPAEHKGKH